MLAVPETQVRQIGVIPMWKEGSWASVARRYPQRTVSYWICWGGNFAITLLSVSGSYSVISSLIIDPNYCQLINLKVIF